jgi:hypothetical protein
LPKSNTLKEINAFTISNCLPPTGRAKSGEDNRGVVLGESSHATVLLMGLGPQMNIRTMKINQYFLFMRSWFLNVKDAWSKRKLNIKFLHILLFL